jgi:16S rRNA (cytosine967-C5)-methyltransferase
MKQSSETPRSLAIDILCEWQKTGRSVDLIKDQFSFVFGDSRDDQLAMALVFGVLRQRGHLDWLLAQFSSHPLAKMKPLTLQALRVGLYQLLFMDRIPASAAINETVRVIKTRRQPKWLSGFVNGLLRNISRGLESSTLESGIPLDARLSHPQWLIDRWLKRYGPKKTEEICLFNNTPAQLCLCVNTVRTDRRALMEKIQHAGILVEEGRYAPEALILPDYRGSVANLPGFAEGLFQVQDEVAQLVVYLFSPFSPGDYLDGCAGLGGKTFLLAQKMREAPGDGSITAVEPQASRSALLAENLARLGCAPQIKPFVGEIASFANRPDSPFTGVLIDAPCSGIGVIRRHPDIRWNRKPDDFGQFQNRQRSILKVAAGLTKAGGALVYATCSTEPEENDEVVALFLKDFPEFRIENAKNVLPEPARGLVDENGFLKTIPGKSCSDGFFAALLRKL